jgi:hypothetical protein
MILGRPPECGGLPFNASPRALLLQLLAGLAWAAGDRVVTSVVTVRERVNSIDICQYTVTTME